jgi:DNA-binding XRE family transcriptional regulator
MSKKTVVNSSDIVYNIAGAITNARGMGLMPFSFIIKQVRMQLGLSQEQLARELSISFSTIDRWENRKSKPSQMAKELFYNFCKNNNIDPNVIDKGNGMND